jgi:hypothetical protein
MDAQTGAPSKQKRKTYVTGQQEDALRKLRTAFGSIYGLDLVENPRNQRVNTTIMKKGVKVALGEFRTRNVAHNTYDTIFVEKETWAAMMQRRREEKVPFVLAYGFTDGNYYLRIDDKNFEEIHKKLTTAVGGRKDRNDKRDIANMIMVPTSEFKPFGYRPGKPEQKPPEQQKLW